jgi:hypothetical protein
MRYLLIVAAGLLGCSCLVRAAADDGAGPRATLLKYDQTVGPRDAEKAQGLYYANSTRERSVATALGRIDGALSNLREQAKAKYGADVADAMLHLVKATTTADIKAARIKVTGDSATVEFPGSDSPTDMVRVDGEWRISVKAMIKGPDGNPRALRTALTSLAKSVDEVADKIEAGGYAAEDASKELSDAYKAIFK